ncbi:hypothetical protein pb186bvf_018321 [Paramecium bursaria]
MSYIQDLASQRTCKIADHYQKKTLLLCSYEKCEQNTRWACVDCLRKNLHKHNSIDQGYLKDQVEFVQYLEEKNKEIQDNNGQSCKLIETLQQRLKSLLSQINELLYTLEQGKNNTNIQQIQQMINNVKQDFFHVSDENVNQIIQIKNIKCQIAQYQTMDQCIIDFTQKLKQFPLNNNQAFSNRDSQLIQNFQQTQYQLFVDCQNKQQIQQKQIQLVSPSLSFKIQNINKQNQISQDQVQTLAKYNEAPKQQNQQLMKQVQNNHMTQSQTQSCQSYDQLSQQPQPSSQSQVKQGQSVQNIILSKLNMDQGQNSQIKPLNISNQIQRREMSQVRQNLFSNNSQGQKQSQQTINYFGQISKK